MNKANGGERDRHESISKHNRTGICETMSSKLYSWWRLVLSEVFSTALLMFLGCMSTAPLGPDEPPHASVVTAVGFGLVVLINIQIFGHLSGAHMNPSVSLAAVVVGKIPALLGLLYAVSQCIGALIGFGLLYAVAPYPLKESAACCTIPHQSLTITQALFVEVFLTGALTWANCAVWDPANSRLLDSIPIKFGLVVAGLSIVGGPLTGASMNPARTLAPSVWNNRWTDHWIYWVGPMFSSALFSFVYRCLFLTKTEKSTSGEDVLPLDDKSRAIT